MTTPTRRRSSYFGALATDARADLRADLRRMLVILGAFALVGIVVGLGWGLWAPRDRIKVVDGGYAILNVNDEARVGGDVVLLLVLAGVAVLATVAVWAWGPRRGAVSLLLLVVGLLVTGYVAWLTGVIVTPAPSAAELQVVGTVVDVRQTLHTQATLLMPSALGTLLYLLISLFSGYDGLYRKNELPTVLAAPEPAPARRWDELPPQDSGYEWSGSVLPGQGTELEGVDRQTAELRDQADLPAQDGDLGPQPRHG